MRGIDINDFRVLHRYWYFHMFYIYIQPDYRQGR